MYVYVYIYVGHTSSLHETFFFQEAQVSSAPSVVPPAATPSEALRRGSWKYWENHGIEGIFNGELPSGNDYHKYGKSPSLMGQSTVNRPFSIANCVSLPHGDGDVIGPNFINTSQALCHPSQP